MMPRNCNIKAWESCHDCFRLLHVCFCEVCDIVQHLGNCEVPVRHTPSENPLCFGILLDVKNGVEHLVHAQLNAADTAEE